MLECTLRGRELLECTYHPSFWDNIVAGMIQGLGVAIVLFVVLILFGIYTYFTLKEGEEL